MRRVDVDHSDDSYDNLFYHLARYKFISRLVGKSDRLLEIGCGMGYGARFLVDYVTQVVASDLDQEVLNKAKVRYKHPQLSFEANVDSVNPFDVVVCLEVIEHMDIDAGQDLLRGISERLKSGGVSFISTPRKIANPSENRKKVHVHEYEFEEFRAALQKVFPRVLIFSQIDEIISTHHPQCAWNFVAACFKG